MRDALFGFLELGNAKQGCASRVEVLLAPRRNWMVF